jgi:glutamine synthetase
MGLATVERFDFAGWHTGYQDFVLRPDYRTARVIPWYERTALVLCDSVFEGGTDIAVAPRTVLRGRIKRAADLGFSAYAASEPEFYLFRETLADAEDKGYRGLRPLHGYLSDYSVWAGSCDEWLYGPMRRLLAEAGIPIECSKPEYGTGQGEINMVFSEALEMADRHLLYKQGVKEIAAQHGVIATFMAKPMTDQIGSGCHIHFSLWDVEGLTNTFATPGDAATPSETLRHFLGGVQHCAADVFPFYAPYVNSYKRLCARESFAPRANVWGYDNRTVAFRLAGHGSSWRIENRVPGPDVNPYLTYAAMLSSGLYGIEHRIEPGLCAKGNAYELAGAERFPENPIVAIARMRSSEVARQILTDEVVDFYATFYENEFEESMIHVTDWELRTYFERV